MAFDFNGNKRPTPTSGDPVRKDIDYTSPKHDPEGFSSLPPRNSGGFGNRPTGFQNPPSSPSAPPSKPAGFQNRPALRDEPQTDPGLRSGSPGAPARPAPRTPAKRPAVRSGGSSVPWRILLPVIGILIVVALCVIFRQAIAEFMTQLITWAVIILIILLLFKWLIFGGRKKRDR